MMGGTVVWRSVLSPHSEGVGVGFMGREPFWMEFACFLPVVYLLRVSGSVSLGAIQEDIKL